MLKILVARCGRRSIYWSTPWRGEQTEQQKQPKSTQSPAAEWQDLDGIGSKSQQETISTAPSYAKVNKQSKQNEDQGKSFPSPWAHDVFKPLHKNTPTETSKKLNGSITGCHHLDVRLTSGKFGRNINKTAFSEIKAEIGQRRAKTTIRPTIA